MSILMAYHAKTLHARKQEDNQHASDQYLKQGSVSTCKLTVLRMQYRANF